MRAFPEIIVVGSAALTMIHTAAQAPNQKVPINEDRKLLPHEAWYSIAMGYLKLGRRGSGAVLGPSPDSMFRIQTTT